MASGANSGGTPLSPFTLPRRPSTAGSARTHSSLNISFSSSEVPSPSPLPKNVGRPRTSGVWDYMDYQEFDDGSCTCTCKIPMYDPSSAGGYRICDHPPFTHKNTSSLKDHLKRRHPREYQIVFEKDTNKHGTKGKGRKNVQSAPSVVLYSKDDPQHMFITHHLAFFVGKFSTYTFTCTCTYCT